ncbi:MAG: 2-dehydropantoate 2-reductase [Clostridia bacterium]|nr:2-dehydropantoate 2-reductase [Clostridia bacterium]
MKIAIYGAGSLGTILGAYLTEAGMQVDLVNRNQAHVAALREKGATIIGTIHKQIAVSALLPDEMTGNYDLILLLTKQMHNHEVVTQLQSQLSPEGVICTLQNGIPEISVAEVIGEARTCGGTVAWGATMKEPGVCELTSEEDSLSFGMGGMPGFPQEKLLAIKAVLEKMCPVELEDNFMGVRWSKLLINAVFSGLGTVFGCTFGGVVDNKKAKKVALATIKECIDVGRADGVVFAPVQGKNIEKLLYYSNPVKRALALFILPIALKKHRDIKPSMLQDLEKGKPCEISAINGVVCRVGDKNKMETPFNDRIVTVVSEIEAGKRTYGFENLSAFDDLL